MPEEKKESSAEQRQSTPEDTSPASARGLAQLPTILSLGSQEETPRAKIKPKSKTKKNISSEILSSSSIIII